MGGLIDIHLKTFVGFKPTKAKSCWNTCYDTDNPSFNIDFFTLKTTILVV
jgi:hypothetical protein